MRATKIHMRLGCMDSQNLLEIDQIYIVDHTNGAWYPKEVLHNHLTKNPGTIQVNIAPYPDLIPWKSPYGEKYVKSTPNAYASDNLLMLPRE